MRRITRKMYESIAGAVAKSHSGYDEGDSCSYDSGRCDAARTMAYWLAEFFLENNKKFNRDEFMEKCGFDK